MMRVVLYTLCENLEWLLLLNYLLFYLAYLFEGNWNSPQNSEDAVIDWHIIHDLDILISRERITMKNVIGQGMNTKSYYHNFQYYQLESCMGIS